MIWIHRVNCNDLLWHVYATLSEKDSVRKQLRWQPHQGSVCCSQQVTGQSGCVFWVLSTHSCWRKYWRLWRYVKVLIFTKKKKNVKHLHQFVSFVSKNKNLLATQHAFAEFHQNQTRHCRWLCRLRPPESLWICKVVWIRKTRGMPGFTAWKYTNRIARLHFHTKSLPASLPFIVMLTRHPSTWRSGLCRTNRLLS